MISDEGRTSVVHTLLDDADEFYENNYEWEEDTQGFRELAAALWRQAIIAASEINSTVVDHSDSEGGSFSEGRTTRLKLAALQDRRVYKAHHPMVTGEVTVMMSRYTDPTNTNWYLVQLIAPNLHLVYESLYQERATLRQTLLLNVAEDLAKGK